MPTLTRNTANIIAGVLALALVGGLVIRTSSAVFTADTNNTGNSLAAGTIVLTDDDTPATALFTMTNVAPGEFAQNCITVTYDGSLDPEPVLVYTVPNTSATEYITVPAATGPGTAAVAMEDQIHITIEEGTGGSFDDCTGFTATAGAGHPIVDDVLLGDWSDPATGSIAYTSGDGLWDPILSAAPQSRTYRVTLTLDLTTNNDFQGASLTDIPIIWSTRSTATPGQVPPN